MDGYKEGDRITCSGIQLYVPFMNTTIEIIIFDIIQLSHFPYFPPKLIGCFFKNQIRFRKPFVIIEYSGRVDYWIGCVHDCIWTCQIMKKDFRWETRNARRQNGAQNFCQGLQDYHRSKNGVICHIPLEFRYIGTQECPFWTPPGGRD